MRFVDGRLPAPELTALVQARQAGEISRQTFLENLVRGEILEGRTIDEELLEVEGEADARAEREEMRQAAQQMTLTSKLMQAEMDRGKPPKEKDEDQNAA